MPQTIAWKCFSRRRKKKKTREKKKEKKRNWERSEQDAQKSWINLPLHSEFCFLRSLARFFSTCCRKEEKLICSLESRIYLSYVWYRRSECVYTKRKMSNLKIDIWYYFNKLDHTHTHIAAFFANISLIEIKKKIDGNVILFPSLKLFLISFVHSHKYKKIES